MFLRTIIDTPPPLRAYAFRAYVKNSFQKLRYQGEIYYNYNVKYFFIIRLSGINPEHTNLHQAKALYFQLPPHSYPLISQP